MCCWMFAVVVVADECYLFVVLLQRIKFFVHKCEKELYLQVDGIVMELVCC